MLYTVVQFSLCKEDSYKDKEGPIRDKVVYVKFSWVDIAIAHVLVGKEEILLCSSLMSKLITNQYQLLNTKQLLIYALVV